MINKEIFFSQITIKKILNKVDKLKCDFFVSFKHKIDIICRKLNTLVYPFSNSFLF